VNEYFIPFRSIVKGSYFGEIDIIDKQKRYYTAITAEMAEFLVLSKQIYENLIVKEYPEINSELRYVAKLRKIRFAESDRLFNMKPKIKNNRSTSFSRYDSENNIQSTNQLGNNVTIHTDRKYSASLIRKEESDHSSSYMSDREEENFNNYLKKKRNKISSDDIKVSLDEQRKSIVEEVKRFTNKQEKIFEMYGNLINTINA
jgi:CRP-like cAMP-binding protein